MAAQKTAVTPLWTIFLIASVFFSLSTAFASLSTKAEELPSSQHISRASRRLQYYSPVTAQPAMPPSMPRFPRLPFQPPQQSSPVSSPPPMPAYMPPMPRLPAFIPPSPEQMPYPTPSSMPSPPSMSSPIASPPYPLISSPPPVQPPMASTRGIKGGYWLSSSAEEYPPSTIPTRYFTHLFYAFLPLDTSTYQLSISQLDDQWMANFTATFHAQNPPLITFLSIGGALSRPDTFSKMASSSVNRAAFIKSTIEVARKYGFGGLDLDWVFPDTPEDMSNLALLLKEWRESVEQESKSYGRPRLLISAAVYFSPDFFIPGSVPRSYHGVAIRDYVDFVNTLNFDYHGSWDPSATAEHAVLFDNSSKINTNYGMDAWTFAGVPPAKIVMGLPVYGRTWKLKDPNNNGIGAPAVGVGPGVNGIMLYRDIMRFNFNNSATVVYDDTSVSTYSYSGTDWIGYDGQKSIAAKVEYAKSEGLGGYFLWAINYDRSWVLSEWASLTWDGYRS